jgi:hypothetical protein
MSEDKKRKFRVLPVCALAMLNCSCFVAAMAADKTSPLIDSVPILDVQLGAPAYLDAGGDSWDPAWAQDDNLYAAVNDGAGFGTLKKNIAFNKLSGNDPIKLTGRLQNSMDEYGAMNAPIAVDGRNWKSGGSISIDGTLYMSIGMDRYVDPSFGGRQTRIDASIIKSTDHGLHWVRPMTENLSKPMFPGLRFATPFFIHFGKEYAAASVDNADRYVYATSNNGFWDNGDNYILGRVAKAKIGALNADDWSFYKGGDGMLDASWSSDMADATFIVNAPGQCGETGVTYLPGLKRYVMAAWFYPVGTGHAGEIESTQFVFYDSPKPWGPWNKIKSIPIKPQGWYIPRVLSKFQSKTGNDLRAYIAVAGDWRNPLYYRYTMVPVKFVTTVPQQSAKPRP